MPDTPIADRIVRALAEDALHRYESEYEATHLSWRDFAADVRQDAAAVLNELLNSGLWQHECIVGGGLRATVNYCEVEHLRDDIERGSDNDG